MSHDHPPTTRRARTRTPLYRRVAVLLASLLTATLGTVVVSAAPAQAALLTSGSGRMFYFLGGGDHCLGITDSSFSSYQTNAILRTWSCEGNQRQKWERLSNGQIIAGNGVCLGMLNPGSISSHVTTRACDGGTGQFWSFEAHPQGGHRYFTHNTSGQRLCLEGRWDSGSSLYRPYTDYCADSWDQRFYLDRHSKFRYVALGDSFSAGNGAGNYVDTKCYNSFNNYANKLDDAFAEAGRTPPFTWPYGPSCSGAQSGLGGLTYWATGGGGYWSPQVTDSGYTRQAQTGFLNQTLDIPSGNYGSQFNGAETSVVTMTMGGNDLGFAGLLTDCVRDPFGPTLDCTRNNTEQLLINAMPILQERLLGMYLDIGRKAPNAQIRIPYYPLPVGTSDPWYCRVGITNTEIAMLERTQSRLNEAIRNAVNQAANVLGWRIQYVAIAEAFRSHTACAADPWTTGQVGALPSPEWYHLNARGHLEIARLIRNTL